MDQVADLKIPSVTAGLGLAGGLAMPAWCLHPEGGQACRRSRALSVGPGARYVIIWDPCARKL